MRAPPGHQLHHSLDQRWNPLGGDRRFRRAAVAGALYVVAFLAAALTVPQTSLAGRVLTELVYMVPEAAAAVALFIAGRRSSWAPRFWYLLGASMVAGLVGDANWALYDFVLGLPPVPSLGDIAYTMQPILMILAAVAAFPITRPRLGDVADIAVPFAGALLVMYDVVIHPQLAGGVSAATLPAIIEMQATLVAALMFTTAISGVRGVATGVKLIYAGLLVGAASYPLYSYAASLSAWQHTNWVYTGFQAFFVLAFLGAYERIRHGEPAAPPVRTQSDVNVWLLTAGLALVLAGVVATMHNGRLAAGAPWLGLVAITVVIVRMHQIVRQRGRLAGQLARSLAAQERLATRDALTRIANRRVFDDTLERAVRAADSAGAGVGLLILDLDYFKSINDRYGHPAGDEVLISVARRVNRAVRNEDTLARIGGEEFAVIVPDADPEQLQTLAERCRLAVCADPVSAEAGRITLTASIGAAHYPTDAVTRDALVQAADRALYRAKRDGRNRVHAGRVGSVQPLPSIDLTALAFLERLADQLNVEHHDEDRARALRALTDRLTLQLGVTHEQRARCLLAARLYHIGRVGVPADLLAKTEPLTEAELRILHEHVRIGVDLLRRCDETAAIAPIIGELRERPDGRGYPQGKEGAGISLEAKILAVADAWTAMLTDRPYRAALTPAEARRQLAAGRGSQFDEAVVDALFRLLDGAHRERRVA